MWWKFHFNVIHFWSSDHKKIYSNHFIRILIWSEQTEIYIPFELWNGFQDVIHFNMFVTPQPLRAPGYCRRPSGRAGGRQGRQAPLTLSRPQFFTDHFQTWQGHLLPSNKFDHGSSASLNMRIIDHLMSRPILTFLNSFFKLKSPNFLHR